MGDSKISFTCIGHKEVEHLKVLLPQLKKYSDDIVYVDCESQDGSFEYARSIGCRAFSKPNNMNLNVNKSFAMEQAKGDWIFYVDPDERFPEELIQELTQKISNTDASGFKIARRNHFFGYWLRRGGQYPDHQVRIYKKGQASFAKEHVHERLGVKGKVELLKQDMLHYPYLTISQFLKKFDFYSSFEADYLYKSGVRPSTSNSIKYLVFKPMNRFFRRYVLKGGFRDGIPGFFAAFFDAAGWMTRYFKLWEICSNESEKNKIQKLN